MGNSASARHLGDLYILNCNAGQIGDARATQRRILDDITELDDRRLLDQSRLHRMETLTMIDALGNTVGDNDVRTAEYRGLQLLFAVIVRPHGRYVRAFLHLPGTQHRLPG